MTRAGSSILFRQLYSRVFTRTSIERIHETVGALEVRDAREPAFLHHLEHKLKPRLIDADVFTIAATFMCEIIRNHPFWDGNKRTGFGTAMLLLILGLRDFEAEAEEIERFCKAVARGFEEATTKGSPPPTVGKVAEWLESHSRSFPAWDAFIISLFAIDDWILCRVGVPEGALPLFPFDI